jgi:hypothetical protein
VVDLLVATDPAPASRSAVAARALGLALHEAVHALRDDRHATRAEDEERASLVEACYLLDTVRAGDTFHFVLAPPGGREEFTRKHSARANVRVMEALRLATGVERLRSDDRVALQRARAFCQLRLTPTW